MRRDTANKSETGVTVIAQLSLAQQINISGSDNSINLTANLKPSTCDNIGQTNKQLRINRRLLRNGTSDKTTVRTSKGNGLNNLDSDDEGYEGISNNRVELETTQDGAEVS